MSHFKQYVNMYKFDTILPGSGEKVVFRPVTTGQLKKVLMFETSQDPDVMEKALDGIANECVLEPDEFDVENLYLQDRFYLLTEIRKATKGSKYNFQTTCTSCGSQSQQTVNLGSLPVVRLDKFKKEDKKVKEDESPVEQVEEWNVVKIDDNISVRLGYTTRKMQRESMEKISSMKDLTDLQKSVELSTTLFAMAIKEIITPSGVDKDLSLEDKLDFVDNLTQDFLEKISNWYLNHDFGIKFSFETKCPHCGFGDRKEIPLENFFF